MIHNTSVVSQSAKISDSAKIGPFCVVGDDVELGDGVELFSHICIDKNTIIGSGTKVYPFATIGFMPQDLKYENEESYVEIGRNTVIREHVTIHRGTKGGILKTTIGDNCLLMVGVHVAHDCVVGNNVIMANNATLGGHVIVEDNAIIGGLAAIHQFTRIGKYSIIGGLSGVAEDVIPYGSVSGKRACLIGINLVGMKRHKFNREKINSVRNVYEEIFGAKNKYSDTIFSLRVKQISPELRCVKEVAEIIDFLNNDSKRSICMPEWFCDSYNNN